MTSHEGKLSFVPNRDLLDPSFESYKLCLEPLPLYSEDVSSLDINHKGLSNEQTSFAITHLSLNHNSNVLHLCPFSGKAFLLGMNSIYAITDRSQEHRHPETSFLWSKSEGASMLSDQHYNPSMSFPKESLVIYSDGQGFLYFLDRSKPNTNWTTVFKEEICGPHRPFIILDAIDVDSELHVLLAYVEVSNKVSESLPNKEKDVSVVEWISFDTDGSQWMLNRVRRYVFMGPLEKCCLSKDGKTFFFVTNMPYKVVFDSTLGDLFSEEETKSIVVPPTGEEITPSPFHWFQTLEDITLWCLLPKGTTKRDIKVNFKPSFIEVLVKGEPLMGGKLWNLLESDTMSWTISERKLEISLVKVSEGMIWQRFLGEGLLDGDELDNPEAINIIQGVLAEREGDNKDDLIDGGVPFNMNELEDVDSVQSDDNFLAIVDGDSNKTLCRGGMSGRQWLFNGPESTFCIRHDVDGLIWDLTNGQNLSHVATFSAIGYVKASKQQCKYSVFPPNHSWVALIDLSRHVYLYTQPLEIDSDLRNRKSGTRVRSVSKQSVITLQDTEEILGAVATNNSLILCSRKELICVKVK